MTKELEINGMKFSRSLVNYCIYFRLEGPMNREILQQYLEHRNCCSS